VAAGVIPNVETPRLLLRPFRLVGLGDVISLIRPDNARSVALAERLGARDTGPIEFMGNTAPLYRHARPSAGGSTVTQTAVPQSSGSSSPS
jgi:hypothetical protein